MKKIIWMLMILMLVVGCSSNPKIISYAGMDHEAIYQDMDKKKMVNFSSTFVYVVFEDKNSNWEITGILNTAKDATDKLGEIRFSYENEEDFFYGNVYISDPISPYSDNNIVIAEDAKNKYIEIIGELGMTEEEMHDYLVYLGEIYALPGDEWARYDDLQQDWLIEDQKISKAVCTFENSEIKDSLTMLSETGVHVDGVLWETTYFNPTDEIITAIKDTAKSYEGILGLEYEIDEKTDQVVTKLVIQYTSLNQSDLERVGLVTGGDGLSVIIGFDESVAGFKEDGYTCEVVRE